MHRLMDKIILQIVSRFNKMRYASFLEITGQCRLGAIIIRGFQPVPGSQSEGLKIILNGRNSIASGVVIQGSGTISIGCASFIGEYSILGCNSSITIGKDVMIAQAVTIRDTDHAYDRLDIPMSQQGIVSEPVEIGDDVWIGHGASVLKGVKIGKGAVVAAGAVVIRNVNEYDIVGGVPARIIDTRKKNGKTPEKHVSHSPNS